MPHDLIIVPAFGLPNGMEWIIILVVALLLFGSRLPSMMRGLGGSIKEFKKGMDVGDEKKPEAPAAPEGTVSRTQTAPPADQQPPK